MVLKVLYNSFYGLTTCLTTEIREVLHREHGENLGPVYFLLRVLGGVSPLCTLWFIFCSIMFWTIQGVTQRSR